MAATEDGSLIRRAALAACLVLIFAARSAAQPQPVFVPAPAGPEFLPRYDFHLSVDSLSPPKNTPPEIADDRFSWDTHFGGSFDVVDSWSAAPARASIIEAVEGSELPAVRSESGKLHARRIRPRRASTIAPRRGVIFHHVSRHLSDRPKREAVAWNEIGGAPAAPLRRRTRPPSTSISRAAGPSSTRSSITRGLATRVCSSGIRSSPRVGLFANGTGMLFGVSQLVGRGTQTGGRVEGGRAAGRPRRGDGAVRGVRKPCGRRLRLDREPQRWALAGLRLLSR